VSVIFPESCNDYTQFAFAAKRRTRAQDPQNYFAWTATFPGSSKLMNCIEPWFALCFAAPFNKLNGSSLQQSHVKMGALLVTTLRGHYIT
jgi:hypothetical protein